MYTTPVQAWPWKLASALCVVLLTACLTGCSIKIGSAAPAVEKKNAAGSDSATTDAGKKVDDDEGKKAEKEAEEDAKNERQMAKLVRDLGLSQQRYERARMAREHSRIQQEQALDNAERELALEQDRFQTFSERSAPNRVEWSRLSMLRTQDRVQEAGEELRQLELMYAEEDFADQTKEIVLQRSERRLHRSQTDFELRREDSAILLEKTIPRETVEHEQKLRTKDQALEKARRAADAARLDKEIGLLSAENDVVRLEIEIEVLQEKIDKRKKEREEEENEKEGEEE